MQKLRRWSACRWALNQECLGTRDCASGKCMPCMELGRAGPLSWEVELFCS